MYTMLNSMYPINMSIWKTQLDPKMKLCRLGEPHICTPRCNLLEQPYQRSCLKHKRFRSSFTTEQLLYLEQKFNTVPYASREVRREISQTIKVSDKVVKVWFQNRRMKQKKENEDAEMARRERETERHEAHLNMPSTSGIQRSMSLPLAANSIQNNSISNRFPDKRPSNEMKMVNERSKAESINYSNSIPSGSKPAITHDIRKPNSVVTPVDLSRPKVFRPYQFSSPSNSSPIPMLPVISPMHETSYGVLSGGVLWKPVGIVPTEYPSGVANNRPNYLLVQENVGNKCEACHLTKCRCPQCVLPAGSVSNSMPNVSGRNDEIMRREPMPETISCTYPSGQSGTIRSNNLTIHEIAHRSQRSPVPSTSALPDHSRGQGDDRESPRSESD